MVCSGILLLVLLSENETSASVTLLVAPTPCLLTHQLFNDVVHCDDEIVSLNCAAIATYEKLSECLVIEPVLPSARVVVVEHGLPIGLH